ncbi:alpha/beta-hydrolase [Ramaria rubella]|nr:alpha/beta-hydrolase [Ramaria rubella]
MISPCEMYALILALSLSLAVLVRGLSLGPIRIRTENTSIPLVIWHGLGDSHSSPGMLQFMSLIREIHPGLHIHSIYVEKDLEKDQKAGWFGNVDEQLATVAQQLAVPELQGGFDAIGFSQGGQFLRAYIERYNNPPVHNLITFGSQHMGISDLPQCKPFDIMCKLARNAAAAGVYSAWAQNNVIPAQYFRDTTQLSIYLTSNHFLTSINNENESSRNHTYAQNFASLSNLVLVLFTRDRTVVPKESAWFGSYAPPKEGQDSSTPTLVPMRLQPLYSEDWIGLKRLDQAGRVQFKSCDGEHMQLSRDCWEPIVKQYIGNGKGNGKISIHNNLLVQMS